MRSVKASIKYWTCFVISSTEVHSERSKARAEYSTFVLKFEICLACANKHVVKVLRKEMEVQISLFLSIYTDIFITDDSTYLFSQLVYSCKTSLANPWLQQSLYL